MADAQISKRLREVERQIRKYITTFAKKPDAIKNMTQFQILFYLFNHIDEDVNQKDIGESLGLKKSSITEHLDYLESEMIIERIIDENDRRKNKIVLSDKALKFKKDLENVVDDINDKISEDIPEDKLDVFLEVLDIIESNLNKELED